MADGTFAVLTLALGLWDMANNYCPTGGCLERNEVQSHHSLSLGNAYFQGEKTATEVYYRRDTGTAHGPFQMVYGVSVTDQGSTWAGLGHAWTRTNWAGNAYVQLHAMTGLYLKGEGPDLGGPIEFRSGIELGYENRKGWRYAVSYNHRSNAGIYDENPGVETVNFKISMPLR